MNGFVGQAEKGQQLLEQQPELQPVHGATPEQVHRRDGLPRRARDPQLLDVRAGLRAPGPHVRAERLLEPAAAPLPGLRVVGALHQSDAIRSRAPTHSRIRTRPGRRSSTTPLYAWTDMTYLLHKYGVSWGYYVFNGTEPDCREPQCGDVRPGCAGRRRRPASGTRCRTSPTSSRTGSSATCRRSSNFYTAAKAGTLPAVSWIDPNGKVSEHPTALVSTGQSYVTGLINAIMQSPDWSSTAIFLSWDDWGGFYDHALPPVRRRQRLRPARPGDRDQPVRQARLHRPPDAQPRRLQQVHRGRVPRRPAARSGDRRAAGSAARRARVKPACSAT